MTSDSVHVVDQLVQQGDTLLTRIVNLPQQINVNVEATQIPDTISTTAFLSGKDSLFFESAYSALRDTLGLLQTSMAHMSAKIECINDAVTNIKSLGVGYSDWITIIAIPMIIAIFSFVLPLLYTFITRLDEQYGSAVMATYMKGSVAYKSFMFWLFVALVSIVVFAFNSHETCAKYLLGFAAFLLVVATLRLIRHIFKVNTLEDIVAYLKNSIWSVFYIKTKKTGCPIVDFFIQLKSKCHTSIIFIKEFFKKKSKNCKLLMCISQLNRHSFDDLDLLYALCVRAFSNAELGVEASVYDLYAGIIRNINEKERDNEFKLCSINRFLELFYNKAFAENSKMQDKKLISHFLLCLYEDPKRIDDYVIYMVTHNALNAIKEEEFWSFFFGEIDFGYGNLRRYFLTVNSAEERKLYPQHVLIYLKLRNSLYLLYALARTKGYNLKLYGFLPTNRVNLVATYASLLYQIEDQQYHYLSQMWGNNELLQLLSNVTKELYETLRHEDGLVEPFLDLSADKLIEYANNISDNEDMNEIIRKILRNKI